MILTKFIWLVEDCSRNISVKKKKQTLNPLKCPKLGSEFSVQMCIAQTKWYGMQIIQLFIYQIK